MNFMKNIKTTLDKRIFINSRIWSKLEMKHFNPLARIKNKNTFSLIFFTEGERSHRFRCVMSYSR